jgi:hypothetical protein
LCKACQKELNLNHDGDDDDELLDEGLMNMDQLEYSQKSNSHGEGRTSDPFAESKAGLGPKEI